MLSVGEASADELPELELLLADIEPRLEYPSRRLLPFLWKRSRSGNPANVTAVQNEVKKNLDTDWSPGTVHSRVSELRRTLKGYFALARSFKYPFVLDVTDVVATENYDIIFKRRIPPKSALAFWLPALVDDVAPTIVLTEPVFFRKPLDSGKGHEYYVRYFGENDWGEEAADRVVQHLGGLNGAKLESAYHYVSIDEVHAVLSLIAYWRSGECLASPQPQFCSSSAIDPQLYGNLIVLGTTRGNPLLRNLQGRHQLGIRLTEHIIDVDGLTEGEEEELRSQGFEPSQGVVPEQIGNKVLGIVTRASTGPTTLIASNHGLATRGLCQHLTNDAAVQELIGWAGLEAEWSGFSESFQILFSMELDEKDRLAGNIRPLLMRPSSLSKR